MVLRTRAANVLERPALIGSGGFTDSAAVRADLVAARAELDEAIALLDGGHAPSWTRRSALLDGGGR
jgi:hypothetical protein